MRTRKTAEATPILACFDNDRGIHEMVIDLEDDFQVICLDFRTSRWIMKEEEAAGRKRSNDIGAAVMRSWSGVCRQTNTQWQRFW